MDKTNYFVEKQRRAPASACHGRRRAAEALPQRREGRHPGGADRAG